jgi:5-methylcytosine-specific restriction enzyme A
MPDWTHDEVERTVSDYFGMLKMELNGDQYNKSKHRRELVRHLNNRTEGAVELKHQNISAILIEHSMPYIKGYKPRGNYQGLLADVVMQNAEREGFAIEAHQYPVTAFSWTILSPTVAIKQMDKSAFLHHGTGIPGEIAFFFEIGPDDDRKSIVLIHSGERYGGYLNTENQRIRLFWRTPLSGLIKEIMPEYYYRFANDDIGDLLPEMRFEKGGDDVYSIEFLKPESITADIVRTEDEPQVTQRNEGSVRTVIATRYERDPQNRLDAIRIHGHKCAACGFDFGNVYGDWGNGYIEVHHLTPLAEVDNNHVVNPATDLAPVCSNCHRMIHRQRGRTLSISELKQMLGRRN